MLNPFNFNFYDRNNSGGGAGGGVHGVATMALVMSMVMVMVIFSIPYFHAYTAHMCIPCIRI